MGIIINYDRSTNIIILDFLYNHNLNRNRNRNLNLDLHHK